MRLAFLVLVPPAFAQSIGVIFNVRAGDLAVGGCDAYTTQLNQYYTECTILVNAALTAVNNYATDTYARELLTSFFGIRPDPNPPANSPPAPANSNDLADLTEQYTAVQNFLQGRIVPDGGRPRLYCHSTWLEIGTASDIAKNDQGNELQDPSGNPIRINEVPQYEDMLEPIEDANGNLIEQFPYWAADLNQYVFDQDYRSDIAGQPDHSYCSAKGHLAATQEQTTPRTITLCPPAFTRPFGQAALGDTTPSGNVWLQKYNSQSITLFHELFHLVLGNGATPDNAYFTWECIGLVLANEPGLSRQSPECVAQFAEAYYLGQLNFGTATSPRMYRFSNGKARRV